MSGPAADMAAQGLVGAPSPWLLRWAHLIDAGSTVLDVACGQGRHVRWLTAQGHRVTALDRDAQALQGLEALAEVQVADIEGGCWPWPGRQWGCVLVTHYLWRPLWPLWLASVAPGGVLIYETFAVGNERFGRPARPDFLLQPAELLDVCQGWHVAGYEHGRAVLPDRMVQRIAALKPLADGSAPAATLPPDQRGSSGAGAAR